MKHTTPESLSAKSGPPLPYLIKKGAKWVHDQRALHRPLAVGLPSSAKQILTPFFQPETLDHVRFRIVPSIQNPDFYAELREAGYNIPLDFSQMAGITYGDTVLFSKSKMGNQNGNSLAFHECVHVIQYRLLGINEFIRRYVTDWATNGFDYFSIPLERDAYELQGRFDTAPNAAFSVEEQVALRLKMH